MLVLDISMPDMNGYEAARALRALPGMECAVLIALSGYGHDEARQRARDAGIDYYLTKPAGVEALQNLLATMQAG